jgi:phosphoribosylglycinamide formyltransferase-1
MPIGDQILDSKLKVAIFASGNGSNAESLMEFAGQHSDQVEVVCIITDKPEAGVLLRAKKWNISSFCIPFDRESFPHLNAAKEDHENKILSILEDVDADWICLAGYMRILTSKVLAKFYEPSLEVSKVINIHPSLLPSFPGKNAYEQAFYSGVKMSGVTVHFVDSGIDTGPPILQDCFPRLENDSLEDFIKRGLSLEHQLYRKALKLIIESRVSLDVIANSRRRIVSINKGL